MDTPSLSGRVSMSSDILRQQTLHGMGAAANRIASRDLMKDRPEPFELDALNAPLSPINTITRNMSRPQSPQSPPVTPADHGPPCNTLYVGNLPLDASEDELKTIFAESHGYKRICFRSEANGPVCLVEFEDILSATVALNDLYGCSLHNSVRGGVCLSYSKIPIGVRPGPLIDFVSGDHSPMASGTKHHPVHNQPDVLADYLKRNLGRRVLFSQQMSSPHRPRTPEPRQERFVISDFDGRPYNHLDDPFLDEAPSPTAEKGKASCLTKPGAELERMKQDVALANLKMERERERVENFEALNRRIIAMLGDALRTGVFNDHTGHLSLLRRVEEDAPGALNYLPQSPGAAPKDSQHSNQTLIDNQTSAASGDQIF